MAGSGLRLPRHQLVWITASALTPASLAVNNSRLAEETLRWISLGRPAVARRHDDETSGELPPGELPLGIALPLAQGRVRIAFRVAESAVRDTAPPCLLSDAATAAPGDWRDALGHLIFEAAECGLVFRAFGSLAWQRLSGEQYLRPGSDIDLLFHPTSRRQLGRALEILQGWKGDGQVRLDGEAIFPGDRGVSWRELLGSSERVLVKSTGGVYLERTDALLESLGEH